MSLTVLSRGEGRSGGGGGGKGGEREGRGKGEGGEGKKEWTWLGGGEGGRHEGLSSLQTQTYCNEINTVDDNNSLLCSLLEAGRELLQPRDETFVQLDWVTGNGTTLLTVEHDLITKVQLDDTVIIKSSSMQVRR